jgi:hypothetical protein
MSSKRKLDGAEAPPPADEGARPPRQPPSRARARTLANKCMRRRQRCFLLCAAATTLGDVSAAGLNAVLARSAARQGRRRDFGAATHAALPPARAPLAASAAGACGAPAQSRAGAEADADGAQQDSGCGSSCRVRACARAAWLCARRCVCPRCRLRTLTHARTRARTRTLAAPPQRRCGCGRRGHAAC